jgi:hypothetical protein
MILCHCQQTIQMYLCLHVKCLEFLSYFNKSWILLIHYNKSPTRNFTKLGSVVGKLIHYNGRADKHHEGNTCFSWLMWMHLQLHAPCGSNKHTNTSYNYQIQPLVAHIIHFIHVFQLNYSTFSVTIMKLY